MKLTFSELNPDGCTRVTRYRFVASLITAFYLLIASSCSNLNEYEITFNERKIYSPSALFTDYLIPDSGLATCIEQAIEDGQITSASGLELLNCSNAGIASLDGLSRFTALKGLKLTDNTLLNLVELSQLTELTELQLDGNRIVDVVPITRLPRLRRVTLSRNQNLQCTGLARFPDRVEIVRPGHC